MTGNDIIRAAARVAAAEDVPLGERECLLRDAQAYINRVVAAFHTRRVHESSRKAMESTDAIRQEPWK